jgi:hypothetical protein
VNQKAQVSLEYILISLSIVVVLSLIIIQATTLYSKNIKTIDNRELKKFYQQIQENIDISQMLENYSQEIEVVNQREWNIEKINEKYKISNEDKEYFIESYTEININFTKIDNDTLIFKKENNKIYLEKLSLK